MEHQHGQVAAFHGQVAAQFTGMDANGGHGPADAKDRQAPQEDHPEQQRTGGDAQHHQQMQMGLFLHDDQIRELILGDHHFHPQGLFVLEPCGDGTFHHIAIHLIDQVGLNALEEVTAVKAGNDLHAFGERDGEGHFIHRIVETGQQGQPHQQPDLGFFLFLVFQIFFRFLGGFFFRYDLEEIGEGVAERQFLMAHHAVQIGQGHQIHAGVDPAGGGSHGIAVHRHIRSALGHREHQALDRLFQCNGDRHRHPGTAVGGYHGGVLDVVGQIISKNRAYQQHGTKNQ